MQVHEVVHHAALEIVLDTVDDNMLAHVHDLQVRQMALVLVDSLIHLLIVADALPEVLRRRVGVQAAVVRGGGLDLEDVAHDESLVVALGLHKQRLNALIIAALLDPAAALLGGVGRVEDAHDPACLEPL